MTSFPPGPVDGTHIFDDFQSNAAVGDALVGNLNWEMVLIANASAPTYVDSPNGILRVTTDGASADGEAFLLHPDALVLAGTNQVFRCRVRLVTTIAANNFRIGFIGFDSTSTASQPEKGIWVDCAAGVLSFDSSSTNGDKTKTVTGIPTLTSGTTMVADTWHDLELQMSGENSGGGPDVISCFVDGFAAGQITGSKLDSTETLEFCFLHWATASSSLIFDIDYYEAYLPRN